MTHNPSDIQQNNQTSKKKSERPFWIKTVGVLGIIIVVLLLIAAARYAYIEMRDFVRCDDAYIDADKVAICGDITARITHLEVQEGEFVKKGQVIVLLDDTILLKELKEAETNINVLEENLAVSHFEWAKSMQDYQRGEKSVEQSLITGEMFEHLKLDQESKGARVQVAVASIEQGYATKAVIEEKLKHTTVVAPRDGYLAKRWLHTGDVVVPGQAIFTLYDLNTLRVQAFVEEKDMAKIRNGTKASITVDTYEDIAFTGEVFLIQQAVAGEFSLIPPQNASGNFTKVAQRFMVRLHIKSSKPEETPYLFPGMSVEVKFRVME